MLSERNDGASISEVCGIYLGNVMKNVMRVFSVVLLVMVGTVFAVGPAGLIVTLFKNSGVTGIVTSAEFWLWIILLYYFIATFISIDKIIGRIYPLFGICLIIMAVGVIIGIFTHSEYTIPAGTYTGQTEEVKTLSVQAVLLAGDSLSENTVKELTELLFLHGKDIRYAASIELKEDEQSAIGGITIPFHKGAAAYYAECGIEVPTE